MNRIVKNSLLGLSLSTFLISVTPVTFGSPQSDKTVVPADNTKVNKRDRNANKPTSGAQKENKNDRTITQNIRRAVRKDKALSTYDHNVKIITQNGMVTLRGPVSSEAAKQNIEAKAAQIAGKDNVKNELEVSSKPVAVSKGSRKRKTS